ncbi:hypothetical protein M407DRAFT_9016 [Tulasnella calospora MUT 4182]|uniref:Uncharacterized protein n=1 Tax=Tulasnella calospora MUT 4182 TaxID=1051891 RepID=A0A0C3QFY0_9AGAM|nr:hypothetical protein M407DRAFT_9016 [Tulasnella calospora MUT 4182]
MPADPRLLRLRIQRLMQHGSIKSVEIAELVEQAEELAQNLSPEKTCKDNTWSALRSSGLLEELAVMATTLPGVMERPTPIGVRWFLACISALYHAFRVIDFSYHRSAEVKLGERCALLVSRYVKWFGSPSENWPGLPRSRRQFLLLVYRLSTHEHGEQALPDNLDESFVGLIDFDEMVRIIVPNIFDPPQIERQYQLDNSIVWAGCHILSTYGRTRGLFNTTAEEDAKKYGADNMAKRCAAIIETIPASVKLLAHVSSLVRYLLSAPSLHGSCIEKWRLHFRIMKRWWEAERIVSEKPFMTNGALDHSLFFSDLRALLEALPSKRLQKIAISDLIQEQDLILLLGFGPISRDGPVGLGVLYGQLAKPFFGFVVHHCRNDVLLMAQIGPMWLHVMDSLRLIKRCANPLCEERILKESSEIDLWQAFGVKLGLSEESLRQEQAQARQKDSEGLVGCFSLKCPLYGEDINGKPNSPLRCMGPNIAVLRAKGSIGVTATKPAAVPKPPSDSDRVPSPRKFAAVRKIFRSSTLWEEHIFN